MIVFTSIPSIPANYYFNFSNAYVVPALTSIFAILSLILLIAASVSAILLLFFLRSFS
uniref:Uncharacterized protein n=1 Tax=Siphoviridae sp. ct2vX3 TaxID=2825318 RepID=A0A8S5PZ74_9CAUD|nr:MAG TPA: hypothetical protein [Siphoviridae sp. ct2vX3]